VIPPWRVERLRGGAADLHSGSVSLAAGDQASRAVRVLEATRPALVLGSAQPAAHVDAGRAARAGVEVVRRRSGGGAVIVGPDRLVWVDVLVPAGDPLWDDDIGRAAWWLGEVWIGALADVGVDGAELHRGGLLRRPWSDRVCFAGLGPGEVTVGGSKVVGLAQRRTRAAALFQCAALLEWNPGELLDLLDLGEDERRAGRDELAGVAAGLGASMAAPLPSAFLARLD
jgi:lipoate-protein ligase A